MGVFKLVEDVSFWYKVSYRHLALLSIPSLANRGGGDGYIIAVCVYLLLFV